MQNPFSILGISNNATIDEARAAYRRLANKHHPDKGGDTATFQQIQTSWDKINSGYRHTARPKSADGYTYAKQTNTKQTNTNHSSKPYDFGNFSVGAFTSTAYSTGSTVHVVMSPFKNGGKGFVAFNGVTYVLHEPVPNGWRGSISGAHEDRMPGEQLKRINVCVSLTVDHDPNMFIRGFNDDPFDERLKYAPGIGDAVTVINVNAIYLIVGGWYIIHDVFGESHKFRIPAGFDPTRRLRVAGAGYYRTEVDTGISLSGTSARNKFTRADLIIQVNPIFTTINELSTDERNTVRAALGEK